MANTMIHYKDGSIFDSDCEILVNPVNTFGIANTNLTKDFQRRFPGMYAQYSKSCERGEVRIGEVLLYAKSNPKILIFPIKTGWRLPATVENIEAGLLDVVRALQYRGVKSMAFPALGCGSGGLDFDTQVQPLFEKHLSPFSKDMHIEVYIPAEIKS